MNIGIVRLRVAGCGQSFDFELETSSKVGAVLDKTAEAMGLARHHIKMLYRGKQIGGGNDGVSLDAAGIRDRTKLMLMYTGEYHKEKEIIEQLAALSKQVDDLDPRQKGYDEFLTQIMCKLDGVDTAGSEWLRARRKAELVRIEGLSAAARASA